MALRSCGQSPDRAGVIVYPSVEVVIVLCAGLSAFVAIIRRWFRVPDQIVDLDEAAGKVSGPCVVNAEVFGEPFNLGLRNIHLPVAEERVDVPSVTANGEERTQSQDQVRSL